MIYFDSQTIPDIITGSPFRMVPMFFACFSILYLSSSLLSSTQDIPGSLYTFPDLALKSVIFFSKSWCLLINSMQKPSSWKQVCPTAIGVSLLPGLFCSRTRQRFVSANDSDTYNFNPNPQVSPFLPPSTFVYSSSTVRALAPNTFTYLLNPTTYVKQLQNYSTTHCKKHRTTNLIRSQSLFEILFSFLLH